MLNVVTYTASVPEHIKNTTGKPDENGYYKVVLGAFNVANTSGTIYRFSAAKKWFESNSILMKRIKDGQLRSEADHPKMMPGETLQQFIARLPRIDRARVCAHIKSVSLQYEGGENDPVVVVGEIKPTGRFGQDLKDSLDNPEENTAFSVRSIVRDLMIGGQLYKDIVNLITWDWVNEPGIKTANKWDSAGLEEDVPRIIHEVTEVSFTEEDVRVAINNQENLGNESMDFLKDLEAALRTTDEKPFYSRW